MGEWNRDTTPGGRWTGILAHERPRHRDYDSTRADDGWPSKHIKKLPNSNLGFLQTASHVQEDNACFDCLYLSSTFRLPRAFPHIRQPEVEKKRLHKGAVGRLIPYPSVMQIIHHLHTPSVRSLVKDSNNSFASLVYSCSKPPSPASAPCCSACRCCSAACCAACAFAP